ncbi:MAG: 2-oxoacid:acceptor oxidoreductase family protein [Oscillospiraceae bacterium]|nr:2-oxoacid:acceptor oxidoreductase family protein [Oscillospiraceae bacterium]
MKTRMFFAGSGGQGILLMGQLIAKAAMYEGKEVTFMPSYGPEMRGGTANCTVIVSDSTINCPLINEADVLIVMNQPSLIKFEGMVAAGGKVIINTSLIEARPGRDDIECVEVDANGKAVELGNEKTANMIMLGAIVASTGVVGFDSIDHVLQTVFTGDKARFLPLNEKAVRVYA